MINYDKMMQSELETLARENMRPRILLHSCCAPCSSYVIECLNEWSDLTLFYYNPNIFPDDEYRKRLAEQKRFVSLAYPDITVVEGEYDAAVFEAMTIGLKDEPEGGARCRKCFELRLNKTAEIARELRTDYFTTTLSVSPHKNATAINEVMLAAGEKYGVKPLLADFKKRNGYKRSVELSGQYGLYRQNYCGCKL